MRSLPDIEIVLPHNRLMVPTEDRATHGLWAREIPGSRYVLVRIEDLLEVEPLSFEQIRFHVERFLLPGFVEELQNAVGLNIHRYKLEGNRTLIAVVVAEPVKHNLLFAPLP